MSLSSGLYNTEQPHENDLQIPEIKTQVGVWQVGHVWPVGPTQTPGPSWKFC